MLYVFKAGIKLEVIFSVGSFGIVPGVLIDTVISVFDQFQEDFVGFLIVLPVSLERFNFVTNVEFCQTNNAVKK